MATKTTSKTDESVAKKTGRAWDAWLKTLDAAGAKAWDYRTIVAYVEREHPEVSAWWRQWIAVRYEQARGKRAPGETSRGFQVGVQRSVALTAAEAWELITSRPNLWLGTATITFEEGERYQVPRRKGAPRVRGEIRVVKPKERLRMTWQPDGWSAAATVQITLLESSPGKTAIHAQLEKLPDGEAREAMRERWRDALERIAAVAA